MIGSIINWTLLLVCVAMNIILLITMSEVADIISVLTRNQALLFGVVEVLAEAHN